MVVTSHMVLLGAGTHPILNSLGRQKHAILSHPHQVFEKSNLVPGRPVEFLQFFKFSCCVPILLGLSPSLLVVNIQHYVEYLYFGCDNPFTFKHII